MLVRVASAKPRAAASFEPGARSRCTSIATTRARAVEGARAINRSSSNRRTLPSTAATCPCGQLRTISSAVVARGAAGAPTRPRRTSRKASTRSRDQPLRFASVRFLTWPCSRKLSRRRIAGGEERLGIVAMYMPTYIPYLNANNKIIHAYVHPDNPHAFLVNSLTLPLTAGGTSV